MTNKVTQENLKDPNKWAAYVKMVEEYNASYEIVQERIDIISERISEGKRKASIKSYAERTTLEMDKIEILVKKMKKLIKPDVGATDLHVSFAGLQDMFETAEAIWVPRIAEIEPKRTQQSSSKNSAHADSEDEEKAQNSEEVSALDSEEKRANTSHNIELRRQATVIERKQAELEAEIVKLQAEKCLAVQELQEELEKTRLEGVERRNAYAAKRRLLTGSETPVFDDKLTQPSSTTFQPFSARDTRGQNFNDDREQVAREDINALGPSARSQTFDFIYQGEPDPNPGMFVPSQRDFPQINPINSSRSFERCLPKWQLSQFSGDPLQWPEWSSMFLSTVDKSPISNDEKMNHLKTLLVGRAKEAVAGMGYSGQFYDQAWQTLKNLFGRPQLIVDCQLSKLSSWNPVKIHDSYGIVAYSTLISNVVNVLTNMNYFNDLRSSANLNLALSKLPINLKEQWLTHVTTSAIIQPGLTEFNSWLAAKALVHDHLSGSHGNIKPIQSKGKGSTFVSEPKTNQTEKPNQKPDVCVFQDGIHKLWNCAAFKKQTVDERLETVKKHKLCFGCFSKDHTAKDCKIKPCGIEGCIRKHNRMLHKKQNMPSAGVATGDHFGCNSSSTQKANVSLLGKSNGLLPVVPIQVQANNKQIDCLALCDTGSTITWIDESLKKKLFLDGKAMTLSVAGINGANEMATECVQISIGKIGGQVEDIEAYTHTLEVGSSTYDLWDYKEQFPHLNVLPSAIYRLKNVKVILGQNCYHLIRPLEYRQNGRDKPWAVKTELGWTLSGPLPRSEQTQIAAVSQHSVADNDGLASQLKSWWNMESYKSNVNVLSRSAEDKRAEHILEKTTKLVDNRYEVGLLWAEDGIEMPNNFCAAASQFYSLENRLEKDKTLKESYQQTIENDLKKGFIRELTVDEIQQTKNDSQWYLPHHPVLNPHKPGKVRRVCNAASKFKGVSLNDKLLTGPDLLQQLIGVIWRFREEAIAIAADIESMFLQVGVPSEDAKHLRFLWRSNSDDKLTVFEYNRHIFGAKSSPACAQYALRRTATDNASEFPTEATTVIRNIYMDDLLKSLDTSEKANKMINRLSELLKKRSFELKKWLSNDDKVNQISDTDAFKDLTEKPKTSVLGCQWSLSEDTLQICRGIERDLPTIVTQRVVLSFVSAVFDPMGLAAPFTINMRLLLKSIWQKNGQTWDEALTEEDCYRFRDWYLQAKELSKLAIPRFYTHITGDYITLHVFCDASLDAMGIVAYFRFGAMDSTTEKISFIIGKARVAPLKQLSIPKLELQSALFAARIKDAILTEHDLEIGEIFMWSDSTTVIQWLFSAHKKQPVFIANRVAEIMDLTTIDQWQHVPGAENPADIATRGVSASTLKDSVWLTGPAWLKLPKTMWPSSKLEPSNTPEQTALTSKKIDENVHIDWSRFSKWNRLLGTIARVVKVFRLKTLKIGKLTTQDFTQAEKTCWRLAQKETFAPEYKQLIQRDHLNPSSKIIPLAPFMDDEGLIRAKGRLGKSDLNYETKHPIILPKKHAVVDLFIKHLHETWHHEGVEFLRAQLQQKYWILNLRNKLRQMKSRCLQCRKYAAKTISPFMSDLPSERVTQPMHPFTNVGIDYFGPFMVKFQRKIHKRWCCLFTCLATRAVHIEIAESLDTDACMNCIVRFMARRGKPFKFISDNGTNFVGAAAEFKACIKDWNQAQFEDDLKLQNIQWQFNPPSSPHFGGIWERLVRSCKKSMYFILGNRSLTPEVLSTVVAIVEQNLNSRPITPVSSDVNDLEALTPNHFLLGRSNLAIPYIPNAENFTVNRKTFKQAQAYADHIWQRWMKEYIPLLTQRKIWNTVDSAGPIIGDLVWLVDTSDKRGHYPLARVLETFPGKDGHVRSVKLKTSKGTYIRPCVKLAPVFGDCVLPPEEHGAGDVGAKPNNVTKMYP